MNKWINFIIVIFFSLITCYAQDYQMNLIDSPKFTEHLDYYLERGKTLLLHDSDYLSAIEDFSMVLAKDYYHFEARLLRSVAYFELGETQKAKEDAFFARKIYEEDARLNGVLGIIFMKEKRYYDAADFFTRQIQLDPDNPQGYVNRAWALLMLPHYNQMALMDYDEALKKAPTSMAVLYGRVDPLLRLGHIKEAEDSLTRAINFYPDTPILYFKRNLVRMLLGNYRGALADSKQVLRMVTVEDSLMSSALLSIADAYLALNMWVESLGYSNVIISMQKDSTQKENLGLAYVKRGLALMGLRQEFSTDFNLQEQIQLAFNLALASGFNNRAYLDRLLAQ